MYCLIGTREDAELASLFQTLLDTVVVDAVIVSRYDRNEVAHIREFRTFIVNCLRAYLDAYLAALTIIHFDDLQPRNPP
jgi:hypothetical protein